ncbi:hypothetical protein R3W88_019654 [Solanum pinnatisectum]|uniref:Uncharacterized protein n=1 Tax=Solanum pinnatisectum TaxID=50273 RepID=A0AAV9KKX0_9SOLN|nr:hypothetical protein R3W88_019654 [Solanum pinnatisectum]
MKDVVDNSSGKVTTEKVLLLKSSTHQNVSLRSWRVPPLGFCEVRYMSGYWEWVEDMLARCKETIDNIKTYDAIFASLFTCLHVHGSFYDKVIPSAKELTHVDDQGKSFLSRCCSYLFSLFYRLTKGAIDGVSFRKWTKFWFRGSRKYVEPSPRMSKNHTKPMMNHDPSGNIDMRFLP